MILEERAYIKMKFSKRMDLFGESIFTTLANMRSERKKKGLEVIDLSIGAPNFLQLRKSWKQSQRKL